MTDFSKAKFLEFLDFLGNKGLMNKMTVASRKAAVKTFLSILSDQEAQDVTKLDLNELAIRFSNLKGAEFKPESIKVYKSRVTTALEDFKKYRANPLSFKPTVGAPRTSGATKAEKADDQKPVVKDQKFLDDQSGIAFPVPIRPNVVVRIVGIPSDLTKKEAAKIGNVIAALATVDDE